MVYSLSGSGTQALSAGTGALRIHVTTLPSLATNGNANPLNLYGVGLIRQGDGTSWWRAEAIDAVQMLLPLLQGTTEIGYSLLHGAEIDVTEVIETSPFYLPSAGSDAALSDVTLSVAAADITSAALPNTKRHLRIVFLLRTDGGAQSICDLFVNADTTAGHYTGNEGSSRITVVSSAGQTAGQFTPGTILLPSYADATSVTKNAQCALTRPDGDWENETWFWTPAAAAPITSVTMHTRSGNFVIGSRMTVFGE